MSGASTQATVEVHEEAAPVVAVLPSREELIDSGISAKEADMAEKHGLVKKAADGKDGPKAKDGEGTAKEAQPEPTKPPAEKVEEQPKQASDAEKRKKEWDEAYKRAELEEDPVKEQEKLKTFNPNETALYFSRKRERAARQKAEAQFEHMNLQFKAAQAELESLKKKPVDPEPVLNEDGEAVDPGEKPLTENGLKALREKENQEKQKKEQEQAAINRQRVAALNTLEADAATRYQDFSVAAELGAEILKKGEEVFAGDAKAISKARRKAMEFFELSAKANESKESEYNAADALYELGQLHPKYPTGGEKPAEKEPGALPPEKIEKAVENAAKRSSATLNGGGSRKISVEDITVAQAASLSASEYGKLPKHVRERLKRS